MTTASPLFTPIRIGPMTVPNRIVETTYSINSGRADGLPDAPFIAHHAARARGGAGWIGGETWVLPTPLPPGRGEELLPGAAAIRTPIYDHPDFVPRVRAFADAIHAHGAVAVMQLTHLQSLLGPSAVPAALNSDVVPRALDEAEIEAVLDTYGAAAARFAAAGADAVEIHAAHETLPQSFLSPYTNRRRDRWGGDEAGRTRFVCEAIRRVRARTGDALAVGLRLCADEHRAGGYDLADMMRLARRIVETVRVDYLSIDKGSTWGVPSYVPPMQYGVAPFADAAAAIRRATGLPIVYAGRAVDAAVAERLLADGVADLVGMTRALLADPDLPAKTRAGRPLDVRPCVGCNTCIGRVVEGEVKTAACAVNPEVGHEADWPPLAPVARPRRIVVVGGGPAGLEAARVAATRGHHVVLLERADAVGGMLRLAARAPERDALAAFPAWAARRLAALDVDVRLGVEATTDAVLALAPDAVIVATGARPRRMDVPGAAADAVSDFAAALADAAPIGPHVVIASEDDHMLTPSLADYLAARGHRVEIAQKWLLPAGQVDRYTKGIVLARLRRAGVVLHPSLRVHGMDGRTVLASDAHTGEERRIEDVDTLVLSLGMESDDALYHALAGRVPELHRVGSAFAPRYLLDATQHGASVGRLV
jgi:2,4-dienoyl-CoA reductase-like NADH-dependent reductase (Old Yellow Enzyme family)/thioredoxin reductase